MLVAAALPLLIGLTSLLAALGLVKPAQQATVAPAQRAGELPGENLAMRAGNRAPRERPAPH